MEIDHMLKTKSIEDAMRRAIENPILPFLYNPNEISEEDRLFILHLKDKSISELEEMIKKATPKDGEV